MWRVSQESDKEMQRHFSRETDSYPKNDKFVKATVQKIRVAPSLSSAQEYQPHYRIQNVQVVEGGGGRYTGKYYWKVNFFIVLLPFVLCGIPIHVLLFHKDKDRDRKLEDDDGGKDGEQDKIKRIRPKRRRGMSYWMKALFATSCPMTLFTLVLIPFAVAVNLITLTYLYLAFRYLLVLGQIDPEVPTYIIGILLYLPFLILVDYVWIFGYSLQNLLQSFSSLSLTYGHGPYQSPVKFESTPNCRFKMLFMYFVLIMIHIIHYFLKDNQAKSENWDQDMITWDWISYLTTIFYSLMLPVYACFCWAISFQFQILANFIDVLIRRKDALKMEYLALLKTSYRIIADSIIQMNVLFSIFFSWILVALAITVYSETNAMFLFFFRYIFSPKGQTSTMSSEGTSAGEQQVMGLTPAIVRSLVGQMSNLLLYLFLVVFTIWQAITTNDAARYFHVWLNDFASEQVDTQIIPVLHAQVFQAFKQLKFYVHSRMEQERPALLNITLLALVPALQRRLTNYRVLH